MQLGLDVQTFNEVYGPTCNPHNTKLSAGGSSGGCHEPFPLVELCALYYGSRVLTLLTALHVNLQRFNLGTAVKLPCISSELLRSVHIPE